MNAAASPLARACGAVLHQESGDDSPVYTTGYTAALQAVGLLGEHWSGRRTDWTLLPALAREVLDTAAEPMVAWSEVVVDARIVDVVAAGVSSATAGRAPCCSASRPACTPPPTRRGTTCTGRWSR